jgi:hypothetical protein
MESKNPQSEASARLKTLLKEGGLTSYRLNAISRFVPFQGRLRGWTIVAALTPDWLHTHTFVCKLPSEPGLRARLFESAMHANAAMGLGKFTARPEGLVLEIDYRAEHIDALVLRRLLDYFLATAEEHYPKIFRIASGDETLDALESNYATAAAA